MADAEVIGAMIAIRESGQELAAIVHSHPASSATLSRTDRTEAYYPDAALIVVSFQADPPEPCAWIVSGQDSCDVTKLCLHVFNPS
jgi:proteasome lid subunit RPN8/RPN11